MTKFRVVVYHLPQMWQALSLVSTKVEICVVNYWWKINLLKNSKIQSNKDIPYQLSFLKSLPESLHHVSVQWPWGNLLLSCCNQSRNQTQLTIQNDLLRTLLSNNWKFHYLLLEFQCEASQSDNHVNEIATRNQWRIDDFQAKNHWDWSKTIVHWS